MKLIVTVDVEEDNWGAFDPVKNTLKNIEMIPELQGMFDRYHVRPTYLINYPVAVDARSISILGTILEGGKCEIGTHCHPWNTPPFEEIINERNSMICNLPPDLQFRKLQSLTEMVNQNFNISPVSFRAGRWGISKEMPIFLEKLGYKVDSSITPFTNWTKHYGPNFYGIALNPYYFNPENLFKPVSDGRMLEVPASIGFVQSNHKAANLIVEMLRKPLIKHFRLIGLFDRLGLLQKVWLSPEQSDSGNMITLTRRLIQRKAPLINLFFHSPALQPGLTPYVRNQEEKLRFIKTIEKFLAYTTEVGIQSILLSESLKEAL
ncbi:MAG: polysaccharide deacetylase family protein [Nitrospiria bacterium]